MNNGYPGRIWSPVVDGPSTRKTAGTNIADGASWGAEVTFIAHDMPSTESRALPPNNSGIQSQSKNTNSWGL